MSGGPHGRIAWPALAVSAILWALGLGHVGPDALGSYGLLSALPVTWYLALALALATSVWLALSPDRGSRVPLYTSFLLLVLIIHATPAIDYSLPRYNWTFKHIGVIDVINLRHSAPRSADIYFNWPGFFTAATWLQHATGLSLLTMAKWAPPAFEMMAMAAMSYLAASLTDDARVVALAPVLYLLGSWVGQDYFAPQALGYVLAIIFIGASIRLVQAVQRGERVLGQRALLAVLIFSWLSIVTTHQLTPVIALVDIGILLLAAGGRSNLFAGREGRVLLGALIASEVIWVALAIPYLSSSRYSLFTLDPLSGGSSAPTVPSVKSLGFRLRADFVDVLYFGLFAIAGLRGLQTLRAKPSNRLALGLAVAPPVVLLVQSYGGEGQLRTYLFAVPFLAYLLADLLVTHQRAWRHAATVFTVALMTPCFLFAYYGQEQVNIVSWSDLAALSWFYAHAPPGTTPVFLAPNAPIRASEYYLRYPRTTDAQPTLLDDKAFVTSLTARAAERYMLAHPTDYLVVTPSQGRYLDYFGVASQRRYNDLVGALLRTHALDLVYGQADAYIWRVRA